MNDEDPDLGRVTWSICMLLSFFLLFLLMGCATPCGKDPGVTHQRHAGVYPTGPAGEQLHPAGSAEFTLRRNDSEW